jgi:hypothetical protein
VQNECMSYMRNCAKLYSPAKKFGLNGFKKLNMLLGFSQITSVERLISEVPITVVSFSSLTFFSSFSTSLDYVR